MAGPPNRLRGKTLTPEARESLLRKALAQLPDPNRSRRLYAVWCARRALGRVKGPDRRSIIACRVAERFALGRATDVELLSAKQTASNAAANAAHAAAELDRLKGLSYDAAYASERKKQSRYLLGVLGGRIRRPRPAVLTRRILI